MEMNANLFNKMKYINQSCYTKNRVALKRAVLMSRRELGSFLGLLGQQDRVDVWKHAALGNGHTMQQFVQLLVVSDGKLEVTRDDASLLVVSGSVAGQFQHFGGEVLYHSGKVDGSTGTNTLGIAALAKQSVDSSDGKLQTSAGRAGLGLGLLRLASFTASRHFQVELGEESKNRTDETSMRTERKQKAE